MGKITAIVLAAGKGSRMQSDIPKQFMLLDEKPILYYALNVFQKSVVDEIVLVTNKEYIDFCKREVVEKFEFDKVTNIVEGGSERYWSVLNGLNASKESEIVMIHDAARPCIDEKMIDDSLKTVRDFGACTVGVPVKDTIKEVNQEGIGVRTPNRSLLWQIQTPQTFYMKDLLCAYKKMQENHDLDITDDTMIIERYLKKKTKIIMGNYRNIKVTTQEDLRLAEIFLKK